MSQAEPVTAGDEGVPTLWEASLLKVVEETPTVRTFSFEPPAAGLSFLPGQYLVLRFPGLADPRGDSRTFSISSAPSDGGVVSVTTREGPSPFKQRLFSAAPGAAAELWGPFGSFVLDPGRPAVLLGGGIGVTPFRSMIREAAHRSSRTPVVLLYTSRTAAEIVYRRELERFRASWPGFRLVVSVTHEPRGQAAWDGPTSRIDGATIRANSRELERPVFYLCGPPTMVRELDRALVREAGIPATDVRTELFQGY